MWICEPRPDPGTQDGQRARHAGVERARGLSALLRDLLEGAAGFVAQQHRRAHRLAQIVQAREQRL
ncbi:MAG TPA: hypothetical protein VH165_22650, partial [Kofleriaceae bacterium]|nr:hypothetical protein [Kofleriaceae bacterium]